ncbi:MAG: peptidylprolyl isomerase [Gordonia sp. (in: high G+C Gram-positive bacteria)]
MSPLLAVCVAVLILAVATTVIVAVTLRAPHHDATAGAAGASSPSRPAGPTISCAYGPGVTGAGTPAPVPPADEPADGSTHLTLATSRGTIGIAVDHGPAPCNTGAVVTLASSGYYDGATCRRLSDYILMCGESASATETPTDIQELTSGPGWTSPDEFPTLPVTGGQDAYGRSQVTYPRGVVAVLNSDPHDRTSSSSGGGSSVFFIVIRPAVVAPIYALIGTVDATGMDTVDGIAAGGFEPIRPGAYWGLPRSPVTISAATVTDG